MRSTPERWSTTTRSTGSSPPVRSIRRSSHSWRSTCGSASRTRAGRPACGVNRWEPADEQYREAYGYRPETVEHCQRVSLAPGLGDALLFNPENFHSVEPNPGGRRIAFAFFLALTTTGQLIAWS
ncbi:hypothetical protein [Streptomyces sp. NPDC002889]|uniref:hypothetical protein n=1 Tax=Streptomyces sp. NPDC002889 TaxID=3364669 RepID=UPI0036D17615